MKRESVCELLQRAYQWLLAFYYPIARLVHEDTEGRLVYYRKMRSD